MHVLPHCRSLRCHQLGCESVIIAISGCYNSLRSAVTNPCMHLTFISLRRSQVGRELGKEDGSSDGGKEGCADGCEDGVSAGEAEG
jgi:hypothetical protein